MGVLAWFAAQGCAEPCVDDGLVQDPGDDEDCPAIDSNSGTASDSETESESESETEGSGNCNNGVQDGDETDVDCGGSCTADCGTGEGCDSAQDCISGVCTDEGTCAMPTCDDGVQNGDESDVDCGGSCPNACDDGDECDEDADCISMNCDEDAGICLPPSGDCSNGMQDGDETDIDCGGSCPDDCDDGEGCQQDSDCASQNCDEDTGICLPPADSCRDGMQNGDETDVDCGGSCPEGCGDGEDCLEDEDCDSMICNPGTMTCQTPPNCDDGMQNGTETDVDCGGACPDDCDDGEGCEDGDDCVSMVCDPLDSTCTPPSCDDNVQNGTETDLDCGGACGNTCETGEDCVSGADCVDDVCEPGMICAPPLTVDAAPACVDYAGVPVQLTATAMGGTGVYTYDWTPPDGLDDPSSSMPLASPTGFTTYTVTADDGVNQASDTATVVNASPFNLQNNCTLYQSPFLGGGTPPASISYSMMGTRACEQGNNDFGLHLCENVVFQDVQLQGVLEVTNDGNDDDMIGLVWGAQNSSTFYSLSWKRVQQDFFGCTVPAGIVVKRVEAPDFASLTGADIYCPNDTAGSTLLLDTAQTTTTGWTEGDEYLVTIDYTTTGSSVTVTRLADNFVMAMFDVTDATFTSGFFGSTTVSQQNACVGPLNASCL